MFFDCIKHTLCVSAVILCIHNVGKDKFASLIHAYDLASLLDYTDYC